jgi:hypothetical protein
MITAVPFSGPFPYEGRGDHNFCRYPHGRAPAARHARGAAGLLPLALPELFDTAELAQAAGIERRHARQMTYCLRATGVLAAAGKRSGVRRPSAR